MQNGTEKVGGKLVNKINTNMPADQCLIFRNRVSFYKIIKMSFISTRDCTVLAMIDQLPGNAF